MMWLQWIRLIRSFSSFRSVVLRIGSRSECYDTVRFGGQSFVIDDLLFKSIESDKYRSNVVRFQPGVDDCPNDTPRHPNNDTWSHLDYSHISLQCSPQSAKPNVRSSARQRVSKEKLHLEQG
jgi:proline racemase